MNIHWIQHVPFEHLGAIEQWISGRGHTASVTRVHQSGYTFPSPEDFDALILMGGPMNGEDHINCPWLIKEKELVKDSICSGKKVLGICLGAQIIASALGSRIYTCRNKEVGFWPVQTNVVAHHPLGDLFDDETMAFHWHGETFDLPLDAVRLISSDNCLNQAFAIGDTVFGLQCHFEMTPDGAKSLIDYCPADINAVGPFIESPDRMLGDERRFEEINKRMHRILDRFLK